MVKGYDIRPWQPGDEQAILGLFNASFGRTLDPKFWDWRFQEHPAGGPLIMLAWEGDRLAAHYGASQAPLVVANEVTPAALSMTTMTHPDHRGKRLVEAVGEALYDHLRGQGYTAAWGFPNAMINATRRRKLAWLPVCDVPTLSLKVGDGRTSSADPALNVTTLDQIDGRFDALGAALSEPDAVHGMRDAKTLQWRFDANPINAYTRYAVETDGALAGYAITKSYGDQAIDIVDLRAIDPAHVTSLLSRIHADAAESEIAQLNMWCLKCDPARVAVERFGFAATAPVTYFAGRSFDRTIGDFTDDRRWRLSMCDSDLY